MGASASHTIFSMQLSGNQSLLPTLPPKNHASSESHVAGGPNPDETLWTTPTINIHFLTALASVLGCKCERWHCMEPSDNGTSVYTDLCLVVPVRAIPHKQA